MIIQQKGRWANSIQMNSIKCIDLYKIEKNEPTYCINQILFSSITKKQVKV